MTETTTAVRPFPPSSTIQEYGRQVLPGRRMSPGAVGGLDGAGNLGPEHAGALVLTFGAFAEEDSAQRGYRQFTDMQRAMLSADGFLRWISFADGPHGYGLGLWRSADEAAEFVRGSAHRAAVAAQRGRPFEYSQFAGIWAAHTIGRRTRWCPRCAEPTVAPAAACQRCGERLDDGFDG
jgi:heme-degrading monooxygenase HmoA